MRIHARNVRKVVDRQAYHTKLAFEWADGEALYGLGSHEEGMLNLRGQHQYLYQENMKAVVPVLVSTRGYGILLDSASLMTFHDDAFGSYLWTDVADELDYYFVYGPELDQIVHELRGLTGKAPMLPKWAFGYVQSKERYVSQEELLQVVREYRARGLPLDCIVLDWKSWTGELWGQKTLDPERFPDPQRMTAELHALHARLMISIWPIMRPGGANWQEMHEQGFLLGNQATYDAFNPAARACYWKQADAGLFSQGIDAWWCDCTEPFEADWQGAVKPEPEERLRINTEEAKRYLDPALINAYSLLHSQGIYEGQRRITDSKRVVNLTRSAYAGQQRYGTITWSGDIAASWETLRRQIAEGLNFCTTGCPYWTVDIGAFFVKRKPDLWFWQGDYDAGVEDLAYRELYVRWFQLGAFLPMFRAHGTDTPREIWRFGEPGEPMYDALAKYLHLRYRLLPYIYSLAGWVTQDDYTLLRALAFDFRADPAVYDIRDQFMFGPAFLVNPVTQPMYYAVGSTPLAGVGTDAAPSICRPATTGTISGPIDGLPADRRCWRTPRSTSCRSTCAPDRSCRWANPCNTRMSCPMRPSSCTSIRAATAASCFTRMKATAIITSKGLFPRSTFAGKIRPDACFWMHAPDATPACRSGARSRWSCTAKDSRSTRQLVYEGEPIMLGF